MTNVKSVVSEELDRVVDAAFAKYAPRQDRMELVDALCLVRKYAPRTVVELGVACGGTLCAWTKGLPDLVAIAGVDLTTGPELDPELENWLKAPQRGKIFRRDSRLVGTRDEVLAFLGAPVDFLFIDADHAYESSKADFETWYPAVRPGGLIALHDIRTRRGEPPDFSPEWQVWRLWPEIRAQFPDIFEIAYGDACGFGFIRKP